MFFVLFFYYIFTQGFKIILVSLEVFVTKGQINSFKILIMTVDGNETCT